MTRRDTATGDEALRYGYGRQTHGSRKGLGGDPPNDPARRVRTARAPTDATDAQIARMENEGAKPAERSDSSQQGPDAPAR